MNYTEAINYIKDTAKFGSKLGLERTEKILELLGNPHKKVKTIHIAGTNGKGSTTAMITNILVHSGYKVGSYISPYIEEFEERIQINNNNILKEDLASIVTEVSKAVAEVTELGYGNPTEFEIITCAGFLHFMKKQVDFAVVEVGLGGRLDSTNVITPELSIIGSISLDHMNILGDTLEKIAFEKGGIIKANTNVILYPQEKPVSNIIENICKEKNAPLVKVNRENATLVEVKENDEKRIIQNVRVSTEKDVYEISLALLGIHQIQNCNVVINSCEALMDMGVKVTKESILSGLKTVKWPGRLEIMTRNPLVVLDGAHNIDGIKKLSESIDTYFKYEKLVLIIGILADKQVDEMINIICPKAQHIIAVTPHSERAELCEDLKAKIDIYNDNCEAIMDYEEAYERALFYCGENTLLVVSGSLYMVGDMRKIIRNHDMNF
ncbi:folylpolyglutamate synthase/dihydrofolate synthase family protein [Clostridium sp.]|uniref:bifunctional folylpolyglutamate synthase/dihydrofolate synthase n=1 Tax=Clostridium sp. TaxID=1506 RepID=UPI0032176AC7